MISPHSIQEVINISQVQDIIEEYVVLKKRGANLLGLCPFHNEKTPSFTVSPAKNIYKCFGCGKAGSSIQFLIEHEGMSFPDAVRHLAKKYNIELEETRSKDYDESAQLEKDSLYIINEYAKDYFIHNLFNKDEGKAVGLSYFKERGYREHAIKKFELGFALKQRDALTKQAIAKGYKLESLKKLGLASKNDIDFFRDRVMFPIHNLSGKVIAFGGRTLSSDKKIPKYINSPETDIYNKSNSLYGIYQAKADIRKQDECILVEGYTDVISLSQAGIENVIASSGTSLTEGQIRLIKRFTPNITILYDGDAAGIKAAIRGIDLILQQDMNAHVALLPDGEDPDSFVKQNGANGVKNYLSENKKDFIFFKIDLLLDEIGNDPIKKSGVVKNIIESISFIPDQLKRALYIRECSKLLDISEELIIGETNKIIKSRLRLQSKRANFNRGADTLPRPRPQKSSDQVKKKFIHSDDFQERDVLRVLLNYANRFYDDEKQVTLVEYITANIKSDIDSFENELYKTIVTEIISMKAADGSVDIAYFLNHDIEDVRLTAIDLIHNNYEYASWDDKGLYLQTQKPPDENFVKDAEQAILRFKEKKISIREKEIIDRINDPTTDEKMTEQLIRAHMKVKEIKSEIQEKLGTVIPTKS